MPQTDSEKIKIKTVDGGKDKDDLKDCYFYPTTTAGVYDFYDKGGDTVLASGISSGSSFSFTLNNFNWTIPDPNDPNNPFVISPQAASGSWSNDDPQPSITGDNDGESGTFQAQAGGSTDTEEAASTAKA